MPLLSTRGASSAKGFGFGGGAAALASYLVVAGGGGGGNLFNDFISYSMDIYIIYIYYFLDLIDFFLFCLT